MIEVRSARGWIPLGDKPVGVREDVELHLRGLAAGRTVEVGPVPVVADESGAVRLRLIDHSALRLQLGLLAIAVDGSPIGEIDVKPGKMTEAAYRRLRADLERTWAHLVLDADAPTAVAGTGPDPVDLWFELGPAMEALRGDHPSTLGLVETRLRLSRVRSPSTLSPEMVVADSRGRPGRTRVVGPVLDENARALTRDCLQRLHALALRHQRGANVAAQVGRYLRQAPFNRSSTHVVRPTHASRCNPHLHKVLAVRRHLLHPDATLTEGPGELRLGVAAIDRLYEYWVFLKVLLAAEARYGPPLRGGYRQLARKLPGQRLRLELSPGTTVEFPDDVHVAFEPLITLSGRGSWFGLSATPNPLTPKAQEIFTPDVVVLHRGVVAHAVVIDAKYRVRHAIDRALGETHAKYGRLTHDGHGIVGTVVVAHPHEGLTLCYAGMLAAPFVPDAGTPCLPWPSAPVPA